jgi:hypothetical protein
MALVTQFLEPTHAVPLVALLSSVVTVPVSIRMRKHVEREKVSPLLLGGLFGIPLGVYLLRNSDPTALMIALGAVLTLYPVINWMTGHDGKMDLSKVWGYVAGFLGGILGGAFTTSGPPVVFYVSLRGWAKDAVASSLQVYFLMNTIVQLSLYIYLGILTQDIALQALRLAPAVALGVILGSWLYPRVPQKLFRVVVQVGIMLIGINFLIRNIFV